MKSRLQAYAARFNGLQRREKRLVAAVTMFAIVLGGHSLWIEPAQLRAARLNKDIAQQKEEMQAAESQLAGLKTRLRDPNAPVRTALAEARKQLESSDRTLREYDKHLVPPDRMRQLLHALFANHRRLELLSLQTLPPTPLLAAAQPPKGEAKPEARTGKPADAARPGGIVKHGIEIKLAGGYFELLNYVAELEALPQKVVWERMALAGTYPRSELTLTLYTFSLDPVWMVL